MTTDEEILSELRQFIVDTMDHQTRLYNLLREIRDHLQKPASVRKFEVIHKDVEKP